MRAAVALLANRSRRWYASGQGRSGLVAQMAAMRLMYVGFDAVPALQVPGSHQFAGEAERQWDTSPLASSCWSLQVCMRADASAWLSRRRRGRRGRRGSIWRGRGPWAVRGRPEGRRRRPGLPCPACLPASQRRTARQVDKDSDLRVGICIEDVALATDLAADRRPRVWGMSRVPDSRT
jgi:hypothetical protein